MPPVDSIRNLAFGASALQTVSTTENIEKQLPASKNQEEFTNYSEKALADAVDKLNKLSNSLELKYEFTVHKETGRQMILVVDKEHNRVISEIPPKKVLDVLAGILDMVGLLIDKRA